MAYVYTIHPEHDLVLIRFFRRTSGREIISVADAFTGHPGWRRGMCRVYDFRVVDAAVIDLHEVEEAITVYGAVEYRGAGPAAAERVPERRVMVSDNPRHVGVFSVYAALAARRGMDVTLVDTPYAAARLLGLDRSIDLAAALEAIKPGDESGVVSPEAARWFASLRSGADRWDGPRPSDA